MAQPTAPLWTLFGLATAVKLLLIPSYRSTDFEVHRNWLAITASVPLGQWYTEATSQWTLDYPPFFAWFEWLLGLPARWLHPAMLAVSANPVDDPTTVLYQRLTVILADLVLLAGVRRLLQARPAAPVQQQTFIAAITLLNAGLFLVDHIHFQYNGFLLGILLLALAEAWMGNAIRAAIYFSVLLNLKHIYLYCAPAFFVYLLRTYCVPNGRFALHRFVALGAVVAATCTLSLGPFLWTGQGAALLGRLFPFKRGLTHAYWAANLWALYCAADRALLVAITRLLPPALAQAWFPAVQPTASVTRGLVGDVAFSVLPEITPAATLVLTVLATLPSLWALWKRPTGANFVLQVVVNALTSFLFGWHVHEKAILTALVPFAFLTFERQLALPFFILSAAGEFALLPLLFTLPELPIKVLLLACHLIVIRLHLRNADLLGTLPRWASLYVAGMAVLQAVDALAPVVPLLQPYPFLPLIAISAYCAMGVILVWAWLNVLSWRLPPPFAAGSATKAAKLASKKRD